MCNERCSLRPAGAPQTHPWAGILISRQPPKKSRCCRRIRICVCAYQKISIGKTHNHLPLRGRGGGGVWMTDWQRSFPLSVGGNHCPYVEGLQLGWFVYDCFGRKGSLNTLKAQTCSKKVKKPGLFCLNWAERTRADDQLACQELEFQHHSTIKATEAAPDSSPLQEEDLHS